MIDWNSNSTEICYNPRFSEEMQKSFAKLPNLKSHFILSTSGSSAQKWVALSKHAMLVSADSVNKTFKCSSQDVWIKALPNHHVGGLSIYARAYLSNSKVIEYSAKWQPFEFVSMLKANNGSLTSLVPTQVYDLIKCNITCPSSVRAVFVGGGGLSSHLYEKAKQLGWPLLPSYGLTECASQVATAFHHSVELQLLPHIEAKISSDGCLMLKSDALLSGLITIQNEKITWSDPKKDGWFYTEDVAEISHSVISIHSRKDRIIKIAGEQVNLKALELVLEEICLELSIPLEATLLPLQDERLGYSICLVLSNACAMHSETIKNRFSARVLPFERITTIKYVQSIPRTALGKILMPQLKEEL